LSWRQGRALISKGISRFARDLYSLLLRERAVLAEAFRQEHKDICSSFPRALIGQFSQYSIYLTV